MAAEPTSGDGFGEIGEEEGVGPTTETVFERFPRIRLDQINIEYYRGLLIHELRAGWCPQCGQWHTPLRPICPSCWSTEIMVRPVRGTGTVHLLTRLHQGPPVVDYTTPWPLAAIELTEQPGLRIVAPLVDSPETLQRIGQPVELTWIERDGAPWPAFRTVTEKENAR
ncbi:MULTISPECIES: Zn-ribbon domain-containing OB-fold protein [Rhodococcus]|uniref:OB-fold domain-containing protein n=1 Tax=Rhodococcus oxybenzonivorans TaxID=1990687 RepID=A0AAE4UZU2_9NOCA|nr:MULTISPECIES: OB-fold domain-containing protein [Rhodococcus]MDV7241857.1 OB-fold domain-containing protein [Rhodococcus oxybenzonivorans]MDV7265489.1 OB-fold domain-containing protein [Rhodococcus oxybenzonivorans]MDV7273609.1 OB-fold domain-containing protein [Rhodococcus oxybenzonivorans]MDV7334139.1 OB-fold domain-containing protein [Rhodococcus oxybenzonivorans]MDV7343558.1 OB-fold domain-containing protein [Rhodococcus oxybenzonivorans]